MALSPLMSCCITEAFKCKECIWFQTLMWEMSRHYRRIACFVLFILFDASSRASGTAVVLMYHRFGEDRYPETSIQISQFEAQLELLKNEGFCLVPLSSLVSALTEEEPLPPKAVVITIDDAYRSIYEVAYPRLRAYGFPFTVFVATEPVDKGFSAYMTWEQMREMEGGGATFANHGTGHLSMIDRLKGESEEDRITRVVEDVTNGQKRLSEELRPIAGVFAYPYGEFDGRIAERLRKMGYICFGQHSGALNSGSDRRALPRFPISEAYSDIDEFRIKISSLPLPVDVLNPWEPVVNQTFPEIRVTLGESEACFSRLSCFVGGQGRVPIRWIEAGKKFSVVPQDRLTPGRHQVNCTVQRNDGRYFWFSHPWFVKSSDR